MVLIFFSRCHVFYPLFHLSGLPFSFFCKQSHFFSFINIFHSFSPFFYPSSPFHTIFLPFTAFHCLSLPFLFFSPMSILHFPLFSRFCLFSTHFYLFCFFRLFHRFTPSFCHFLDRPSFFRSAYVTFPVSFFTFHVSQNVSRETSFFTIFGLRRSVRSDLLPSFSKITLIFHLSYF